MGGPASLPPGVPPSPPCPLCPQLRPDADHGRDEERPLLPLRQGGRQCPHHLRKPWGGREDGDPPRVCVSPAKGSPHRPPISVCHSPPPSPADGDDGAGVPVPGVAPGELPAAQVHREAAGDPRQRGQGGGRQAGEVTGDPKPLPGPQNLGHQAPGSQTMCPSPVFRSPSRSLRPPSQVPNTYPSPHQVPRPPSWVLKPLSRVPSPSCWVPDPHLSPPWVPRPPSYIPKPPSRVPRLPSRISDPHLSPPHVPRPPSRGSRAPSQVPNPDPSPPWVPRPPSHVPKPSSQVPRPPSHVPNPCPRSPQVPRPSSWVPKPPFWVPLPLPAPHPGSPSPAPALGPWPGWFGGAPSSLVPHRRSPR